jgi:hypothetical protein
VPVEFDNFINNQEEILSKLEAGDLIYVKNSRFPFGHIAIISQVLIQNDVSPSFFCMGLESAGVSSRAHPYTHRDLYDGNDGSGGDDRFFGRDEDIRFLKVDASPEQKQAAGR